MTPHTHLRIGLLTSAKILMLGAIVYWSSTAANADFTCLAGGSCAVNLIAAPMTKTLTLPNGTSVGVPMWGFALDANGNSVLDPGEDVTVPGPRITVQPGTTALTINLTNLLPEPVSIVIPGQQASGSPVMVGGRVRSMAPEAAPSASASYVFTNLKPGTFLYQSGSHPAVQVQMGLYGAVTQDAATGQAYAGVPYDADVLLLYSEIDVALHNAVAGGTYGTLGGPSSTIDYAPSLFMVNGTSYSPGTGAISAGAAGQRTVIRMLNAGLGSRVTVVDNASLSLVAEDGNAYMDARTQASVLLPAGKTLDAIWAPSAAGDYTVYDRTLHLEALNQASAGMLAKLHVAEGPGGPGSSSVVANPDAFNLIEDPGAAITFPTVLSNDTGATLTAELYSVPSAGTLTLNANGTFTYFPMPNFSGVDSFSYRAVSGLTKSTPAQVTLTVAPVQDLPVAFALSLGLSARESKPITLTGMDPDGDSLTFYVSQLPANGTLSIVDPVTALRRNLVAADLHPLATRVAIPGANLTYTPSPGAGIVPPFVGTNTFSFVAADSLAGFSAPAVVTVTVHPLETSTASGVPVNLSVVGSDGAAISGYRWTVEEDRTVEAVPGVLDLNQLAVSFHSSYMPVVQSGDETTPPRLDPTKRYFVSVLPKNGAYVNGGSSIARGQSAVRVVVNKGPLPTAQVKVLVFKDNSPLNGVPDVNESSLAGFQVTLTDAGGRYGMSGGLQVQDVFGNPIGTKYKTCSDAQGCTGYEVDQLGNGFVTSDANGIAVIENIAQGKFGLNVIPPSGQNWIQTSTLEGTKTIDAWVKPNEPSFFTEFGPPMAHAFIGFVQPTADSTVLGAGPGPFSTITGQVTNLHLARYPATQGFGGAPFDFTRVWVGLTPGIGTGTGTLLYGQPADEEGNFSIAGVPSGSYTLAVWDSALNIIIAFRPVTVQAPAPLALGDVPVVEWFTRLYHYVFEDLNQNGFRDPGERGIPEQTINIRFRDGTIYQSSATDTTGFVPFEELFPFFAWQIAEVDYTRFRATGVTVVVDGGGNPRVNTAWPGVVGAELDPSVLAPQPQNENGNQSFRTEKQPAPVLLEAFQGFQGQSSVMLWGKAPYAVPGSLPMDINVAPFDDFPGPGDTDANNNGAFDVTQYHGGIAGIVHYSTTRAENDPRWGAPEPWEPGIPSVRVQLWNAERTRLLNEVTTDSWDESRPTNCQGTPFVFYGQTKDCFDGMPNFNQVRPGLFDGGYIFNTTKEPFVDSAGNVVPVDQRTVQKPLAAGKYVVKMIVPDGYTLVKEEDKNVDFGEEYIPQQFFLTGYPLADAGGAGDAQPRATVDGDPLGVPFCVGAQHSVPAELALFPGIPSTYAGDTRPLCDEKLVTLRNGTNPGANFFLLTEAPIAGHVYGLVTDDVSNEFDPNSPMFTEKWAPPFLPISIRDWTGREVAHTYSDKYGHFNALVPSNYTANAPMPSGYVPSVLTACVNAAQMMGPNGTMVLDPAYDKKYTQTCIGTMYMPGTTSYLDIPVVPTAAFVGSTRRGADAERPNLTPVAATVNGPANIGPYIVPGATPASRTITLTSAGAVMVPNPLYDGTTSSVPPEISRDYGFGTLTGQVFVGNTALPTPLSWSNTQITVEVPVGTATGQIRIVRCLALPCTLASNRRESSGGVTLTVATAAFHASRPPATVAAGGSIQAAIDAAAPGDLILVRPGTYEELVVMHKPVRLQGWGADSTIIKASTLPEALQSWRDKMTALFAATPSYMLPFQQTLFAAASATTLKELFWTMIGGEGAGVTVLGQYLPVGGNACPAGVVAGAGFGQQTESGLLRSKARIDGFTITGSSSDAGVNVSANACYLEISNNRIFGNLGGAAGGIKIGHPGGNTMLLGGAARLGADEDAHNANVSITYNAVHSNAGLLNTGGGGIAIGTGSLNYVLRNNIVTGNFTPGRGGGISHIGLSRDGTIDRNTVIFNESFNQGLARPGGGIYIGGRPPDAGQLTPGSGNVTISNNLIQGNSASGSDGGGIALANINGQDVATGTLFRVDIFGNTIVNNVAALAGGGISLQDAANVQIIHNTIARNDSLATSGAAFGNLNPTDPFVSTPQPAGIVSRGHSPELIAALAVGQPRFSSPRIVNTILWQNRSFSYGVVSNPPSGPVYGLIPRPVSPYWDLAVLGGPVGAAMTVTNSVLTAPTGATNVGTTPQFAKSYFNGPGARSLTPGAPGTIQVAAEFAEGANFIRPLFGPLSLQQPDGVFYGNYHLDGGVNGQFLYGAGGIYSTLGAVPSPLLLDQDGDPRTPRPGITPHRGADQAAGLAGPPEVVPSLSIANVSVIEGNTGTVNLTFTVTMSQPTTNIVTVDYFTSSVTATELADYIGVTNTLTFAPGVTSLPVTVAVVGDDIDEPTETLFMTLVIPSNATLSGTGVATGTIFDNDPPPSISVANASVPEGDVGSTSLAFLVTLSRPSSSIVRVNYATANGTAVAGSDYTAVPVTTLTFPAGTTEQTVSVTTIGDLTIEPNETMFLNLTTPVNATILDGQGLGTIVDNDRTAISVSDVSLAEGNTGSTPYTSFVFTVTMSKTAPTAVTVQYNTSNGTATGATAATCPASATCDYVTVPTTTLTIPAGQTSATATVQVKGDVAVEVNETFFLNLLNPSANATIADTQGIGTIANDDGGLTVSVSDATVTEGNAGTVNLNFTVSLSAASASTVTVTRATANGTTNPATAGTDYVALAAAPISFAPGITSQTVTVVVNGDTVSEPNETLFLNLSGAVNAAIADGQGLGTIVNDDAACTAAPNAPSNLTGTVTGFNVTINWSAPVGGCAPTSYRIQGGPTPGSTASTLNTGNTLTTRTTTSPPGTFYFRVSAVNAFGASGPSNELTVVVPQP